MYVYCWNNACRHYGEKIFASDNLDVEYVLDHRCAGCDLYSLNTEPDPDVDEFHPEKIAEWLNDQPRKIKHWDTDALILCRFYADWRRGVVEYDPEGV